MYSYLTDFFFHVESLRVAGPYVYFVRLHTGFDNHFAEEAIYKGFFDSQLACDWLR